MGTFVKKPIEVEAVRFDGENWHEVHGFVGHRKINGIMQDAFREVPQPATIQAEIWDWLHLTWVGVKTGQWIMKGTQGEFYPCEDDGTGGAPMNYESA
jgi:hypothetical protein